MADLTPDSFMQTQVQAAPLTPDSFMSQHGSSGDQKPSGFLSSAGHAVWENVRGMAQMVVPTDMWNDAIDSAKAGDFDKAGTEMFRIAAGPAARAGGAVSDTLLESAKRLFEAGKKAKAGDFRGALDSYNGAGIHLGTALIPHVETAAAKFQQGDYGGAAGDIAGDAATAALMRGTHAVTEVPAPSLKTTAAALRVGSKFVKHPIRYGIGHALDALAERIDRPQAAPVPPPLPLPEADGPSVQRGTVGSRFTPGQYDNPPIRRPPVEVGGAHIPDYIPPSEQPLETPAQGPAVQRGRTGSRFVSGQYDNPIRRVPVEVGGGHIPDLTPDAFMQQQVSQPAPVSPQSVTAAPESGQVQTIPFSQESKAPEAFANDARSTRLQNVEALANLLHESGVQSADVPLIAKHPERLALIRDLAKSQGLELPGDLGKTLGALQDRVGQIERSNKLMTMPSAEMMERLKGKPGALQAAKELFEALQ